MTENKTQENDANVEGFLNSIQDEKKRRDSFILLEMMRKITGADPRMWGTSIVGFGKNHYKYESGREGDWFCVGFSPRKQDMTVYLTYGFEQHADLMQKLGRHKTGKACLYIKKTEDVDLAALEELIKRSYAQHQKAA